MRLLVGLLGAFACALIASHGSTLNVTIVRMAKYNSSVIVHGESSGQCYQSGSNSSSEGPDVRGEFDWDESLQVLLNLVNKTLI